MQQNSFSWILSADSFETILKSLLGYQSGMGSGFIDPVIRKKMYESAINNTLKNNFSIMLKVCKTGGKPLTLHFEHCLHINL